MRTEEKSTLKKQWPMLVDDVKLTVITDSAAVVHIIDFTVEIGWLITEDPYF